MSYIEAKIDSANECFIEFLLIVFGVVSVFASLYFSCVLNDFSWLSRSGSLMVLAAIVAEYRIATKQQDVNEAANTEVSNIITRFKPVVLERNVRRIQLAAHVSVVVGTLIWGYGDLLGSSN